MDLSNPNERHGFSGRVPWVASALLALGFLWLCLAGGCQREVRYQILTLFFEGVPPLGGEEKPPSHTLTASDMTSTWDLPAPAPAQPMYLHPGISDEQCGGCHEPGGGMKLRVPKGEICHLCHKIPDAAFEFVHGPVGTEKCTLCHRHHDSKYPHLLLLAPRKLCRRCHESLTTCPSVRADPATAECGSCHLPHGGHDRFFLSAGDGKQTDKQEAPR